MKSHQVDAFSVTLESIYASALEPDRWAGTLGRVADLLDAELGAIGFTYPTRGKVEVSVLHEIDEVELQKWREEFASFDPWYERVGPLPLGTIIHGDQLIPWDELRRMDVHRAHFHRWGIDDLIGVVVANHGASHDAAASGRSSRSRSTRFERSRLTWCSQRRSTSVSYSSPTRTRSRRHCSTCCPTGSRFSTRSESPSP